MDQDGNLRISGRKKDIIIRNGNNISARKIEEAMHTMEGVSLAAVVGVSHKKWGEVPCALVVLQEGIDLSADDIMEHLSTKLTKIELPEKILFQQKLPLTSSGKPDKQKIQILFSQMI